MLEYHPRNHYVNDFTLIEHEGEYHLFHIIGERRKYGGALADEPTQGHAVSTDLFHWRECNPVTNMGGACAVVRHHGWFALVENVRRISWSRDLYHWSEPRPLQFDFEQRADWYEITWDYPAARYAAHRDPDIRWDEREQRWVMFFCSRVPDGSPWHRGCVGAAWSTDLENWHLLPPVLGPGSHFFPESPHVMEIDGRFHMLFSPSPENSGLHHAVSDHLLGPYEQVREGPILPPYLTASEALRVEGRWLLWGRLRDRNERSNQTRLAPRALALPLEVSTENGRRLRLSPHAGLDGFRDTLVLDTTTQAAPGLLRVTSGDWRWLRTQGTAANLHERIPPNALFGSSNHTPACAVLTEPIRDFDLTLDAQLPTFHGNDHQVRGGLRIEGAKFHLDLANAAMTCVDATGDLLAIVNLPDLKADRWYGIRVFRCDSITQVYLDGELVMYLPVYGPGTGELGFHVDHSDMIVANIRLWRLNVPARFGFALDDPAGAVVNGIRF